MLIALYIMITGAWPIIGIVFIIYDMGYVQGRSIKLLIVFRVARLVVRDHFERD